MNNRVYYQDIVVYNNCFYRLIKKFKLNSIRNAPALITFVRAFWPLNWTALECKCRIHTYKAPALSHLASLLPWEWLEHLVETSTSCTQNIKLSTKNLRCFYTIRNSPISPPLVLCRCYPLSFSTHFHDYILIVKLKQKIALLLSCCISKNVPWLPLLHWCYTII